MPAQHFNQARNDALSTPGHQALLPQTERLTNPTTKVRQRLFRPEMIPSQADASLPRWRSRNDDLAVGDSSRVACE
jgi:hypothetical protein